MLHTSKKLFVTVHLNYYWILSIMEYIRQEISLKCNLATAGPRLLSLTNKEQVCDFNLFANKRSNASTAHRFRRRRNRPTAVSDYACTALYLISFFFLMK